MRLILVTVMTSLLLGFFAYMQNAVAGVPNAFLSGTVAKSSEVNDNFNFVNFGNIVVKANGIELGSYIGRHGSVVDVLNSNGYIIPIRYDQIYTASGLWDIVYATTDCTGPAYTYNFPVGTIISNKFDGQLYYVGKNASPTDVTIGSYVDTETWQCLTATQTNTFYPLTPNDPSVTGVSSATFSLPLTIERR